MLNLKLILCADGIVLDQFTNNLTAFNILEEIQPEGIPFVIPRIALVAVIEREKEDANKFGLLLRFKQGEDVIIEQTLTVDFQDKYRNHTIFTGFGIMLPKIGTLRAEVLVDGRELGHYEIKVNEPRQPAVTVKTG